MLKCAVTAALAGGGCEVIDGGILTAGIMHFLIPAGGYAGGILITGGHQAAGWNALIPLAPDGSYFDQLRQRELFDLYLGGVSSRCGRRRCGRSGRSIPGSWKRTGRFSAGISIWRRSAGRNLRCSGISATDRVRVLPGDSHLCSESG